MRLQFLCIFLNCVNNLIKSTQIRFGQTFLKLLQKFKFNIQILFYDFVSQIGYNQTIPPSVMRINHSLHQFLFFQRIG